MRRAIALSVVSALIASCGAPNAGPPVPGPPIASISYDIYDGLLKEHVDQDGLVDYHALLKDRAPLDAFIRDLGRLDPAEFDQWDRASRLAFWINAYNAITLVRILDQYPIERGGILSAVRFPANSIRQIDGVWTEIETPVLGLPMTLDHIEHDILRVEFDEPRIHMAIVCAAKSCPPLRAEAYTADRVDAQLEDQSRRFFSSQGRFHIDREKKVVYLSPILSWFADDFVKKYDAQGSVGGHGEEESAALQFALRYVEEDDAAFLRSASYQVSFLEYDWSLNER